MVEKGGSHYICTAETERRAKRSSRQPSGKSNNYISAKIFSKRTAKLITEHCQNIIKVNSDGADNFKIFARPVPLLRDRKSTDLPTRLAHLTLHRRAELNKKELLHAQHYQPTTNPPNTQIIKVANRRCKKNKNRRRNSNYKSNTTVYCT